MTSTYETSGRGFPPQPRRHLSLPLIIRFDLGVLPHRPPGPLCLDLGEPLRRNEGLAGQPRGRVAQALAAATIQQMLQLDDVAALVAGEALEHLGPCLD